MRSKITEQKAWVVRWDTWGGIAESWRRNVASVFFKRFFEWHFLKCRFGVSVSTSVMTALRLEPTTRTTYLHQPDLDDCWKYGSMDR